MFKIGERVKAKKAFDAPDGDIPAGAQGVVAEIYGRSGRGWYIIAWDCFAPCKMHEDELELVAPGKWQREMPLAVGRYWTRSLDGEEAGIVAVAALPDGQLFTPAHMKKSHLPFTDEDRVRGALILPGTSWGGWWWSEPIPACPPFDKEKLDGK